MPGQNYLGGKLEALNVLLEALSFLFYTAKATDLIDPALILLWTLNVTFRSNLSGNYLTGQKKSRK